MIFTELKPIYNRQKSFYRKAQTFDCCGRIYLISYKTVVAYIDKSNRELCRTWNGYSKTTMIHVNEFAKQNIGSHVFVTAAQWREMEVV